MTFNEWMAKGGCGLSAWSTYWVSKKLGIPESAWRKERLQVIMGAWPSAEKEISRFAKENGIKI